MKEKIPEWVDGLSLDDWQFVKRLILASGSLKSLAGQYGISYPTVRIRLNKLINKVKALDSDKPQTEFHRKIKILVADGKLEIQTARELIASYEKSHNKEI